MFVAIIIKFALMRTLKNLNKILKDQGRSRKWLCGKLEISEPTLYNWESKGNIGRGDFELIARLLDVEEKDL